ncbi:MAG: polysaccharide pyruvyl transferase family protein [Armatimonadota bacterium]
MITNIVALNGGDAAILFGTIRALRRVLGEDCRVTAFASHPQRCRELFPEVEFRETLGLTATRSPSIRYVGRLLRALRTARFLAAAWCHAHRLPTVAQHLLPADAWDSLTRYADADAIISSGGTYLKEEYGVLSPLIDYRIALQLRRPLAFFTQSLGPFTTPYIRRAMKTIFSQAAGILLRDERSLEHLREIGVPAARMHIGADAAFALADPTRLQRAAKRQFPQGNTLRVAYSVRPWAHFADVPSAAMERYISSIAASLHHLVHHHQAEITFLSTCQGVPEYDDDAQLAEEIVRRLDAETAANVHVTHRFRRFDELIDELSTFDVAICTRMHMCILSLLAGLPVLPIAYEFKTQELFRKFGQEEWVIQMDEITPQLLIARIDRFLTAAPELRVALIDETLRESDNALAVAGYLANDLWPHTETVSKVSGQG